MFYKKRNFLGMITKLNFDQLHHYLIYHTGILSLIIFLATLGIFDANIKK